MKQCKTSLPQHADVSEGNLYHKMFLNLGQNLIKQSTCEMYLRQHTVIS